MLEGTKNIEYLHSNIHKGRRSVKIARKAYENIKISTPHRVRQRAGALETAPMVAFNTRHNIDGTHVGAPIALTLTALTYTYLILRIFLWEIHIMQ
jgi:hypothetical protein